MLQQAITNTFETKEKVGNLSNGIKCLHKEIEHIKKDEMEIIEDDEPIKFSFSLEGSLCSLWHIFKIQTFLKSISAFTLHLAPLCLLLLTMVQVGLLPPP